MLKQKTNRIKNDVELAQDVLIDEVTEDLHNQQLIQAWNRYKYWLFLAVILVVASLSAFEYYKIWRIKTRLAESDVYEQAAVLNAKGQTQEALAKYETLENSKTDYQYLAQMRRAGILFEEGKDKDALALLDELRQNEKAPEVLRAVAALGFVSHQIESGDVQMLQSILNPYLTVGNIWYGSAAEMSVLLLIREGQLEKAHKLLDETLSMTDISNGVKERLTIIKKSLAD